MKAVTYQGPKAVKVIDKPLPRIEHPDDIILRVTRTAICGSDLHLYHGLVPDTLVGSTFGHEFAGVVEELGSDVATLSRGDRVVVPFNIACGTCFYCQRGLSSCCENSNCACSMGGGAFGYSHTTGGYEGGQAEYVRVPFADVGPFKIPEDMREEDEPVQQVSSAPPLVGTGLKLTPVFSSAIPARGLSGALRRVAYRIPDYRAKRWLLLMVADRVDVIEHRPRTLAKVLGGVGLLGLGLFAAHRLRSS